VRYNTDTSDQPSYAGGLKLAIRVAQAGSANGYCLHQFADGNPPCNQLPGMAASGQGGNNLPARSPIKE